MAIYSFKFQSLTSIRTFIHRGSLAICAGSIHAVIFTVAVDDFAFFSSSSIHFSSYTHLSLISIAHCWACSQFIIYDLRIFHTCIGNFLGKNRRSQQFCSVNKPTWSIINLFFHFFSDDDRFHWEYIFHIYRGWNFLRKN